MNNKKRVSFCLTGVIGLIMYFKRDIHRWYFLNIDGKPLS